MQKSSLESWLEDLSHRAPQDGGVSFVGMNVSGSISSSYFQHTLVSYLAGLPSWISSSLRRSRNLIEVSILRDLHGVVQPGEMLLVLGRPGSGCSSFLKAIAGDVHGTTLHDETVINYRGEQKRD
jgi:ATP-binding cassette subfamily G (WHITE) protein 2 (PDR)